MKWQSTNAALARFGEELSGFLISLIKLAIMCGVPLAGIVSSIYTGVIVASLAGGSGIAVWIFFGVPFFMLLFLSVYVWTPHIWPALKRAVDAL